jgi:biopolymer transport protein ExbD
MTRRELHLRLTALAQATPATLLEIRLEPTARYSLLTDVLAAAQEADVRRISVAPAR